MIPCCEEVDVILSFSLENNPLYMLEKCKFGKLFSFSDVGCRLLRLVHILSISNSRPTLNKSVSTNQSIRKSLSRGISATTTFIATRIWCLRVVGFSMCLSSWSRRNWMDLKCIYSDWWGFSLKPFSYATAK